MNRMPFTTVLLVAVACGGMPGCAAIDGTPASPGQATAYSEGYRDGCARGRASQGSVSDFQRRNAALFDSNKDYAKGWSEAFGKCSYEQSQKMAAGNGR